MRRKIDFIILLCVLIAGFLAVQNAVAIGDWWHARTYRPNSEITKIADDAGMSAEGKRLFYRFEPQLANRSELDNKCTLNKLGCAEGQSIYILDYASEKEYNQAVTTAAHEMLHVAYSRLSNDELAELEPLLKTELQRPAAAAISEKLDGYPESDYINEAHSFIGSELPGVSDALEAYYQTYFSDRQKVVELYQSSVR